MASYVCALTADSGLPLFTRRNGDLKPLPFATVGVLNGVHMFTNLRGAELHSSETPEEKLMWKTYHNCIVLILVTRKDVTADVHFSNILDNIFASMVLLLGLDFILKPGSVEKLKRELKQCYPLIDHLLNQMDEENFTIGDLTQRVDIVLSYNSQALMSYLDKFLEAADSAYGCLLIRGKVVIASKQWMSLSSQEIVILSAFVNSLPKATSQEVAIYLPATCPRASNRLLVLQLLKGIELCVLCGTTPPLSDLDEEAQKIWKGSFEHLKTVYALHPRNFPTNISLDSNILSVLLINKELNQSLFSICPTEDESLLLKENKLLLLRQEGMRTFYKQVVGTHFTDKHCGSATVKTDDSVTKTAQNNSITVEYYMCTEEHKCYSINSSPYQIFILFNKNVPQYALRSVSHKTLKLLTAKKLLQRCAAY